MQFSSTHLCNPQDPLAGFPEWLNHEFSSRLNLKVSSRPKTPLPDMMEALRDRIRAQSLFTLSMTAELSRVLDEFSRAKIDTILIKGPITSILAYGDPGMRSYVDLDLLVRHQDIALATQRLLAIGFEADTPEALIQAGKIPGEYLFNRPGAQHIIELHTDRTFRYYPRRMPIEQLFARRRSVLVDGREVPALSLEDELVLDCVHGAKHFWERLMWVSDIAAMVVNRPAIDWGKACEFASEGGTRRMLRVGVLLGDLLFGVKPPAVIAEEIARDLMCEKLCRQIQCWLPYASYAPPPLPQRALFRMNVGGGGWQGLAYLMRLSLSPTEEDWRTEPRRRLLVVGRIAPAVSVDEEIRPARMRGQFKKCETGQPWRPAGLCGSVRIKSGFALRCDARVVPLGQAVPH